MAGQENKEVVSQLNPNAAPFVPFAREGHSEGSKEDAVIFDNACNAVKDEALGVADGSDYAKNAEKSHSQELDHLSLDHCNQQLEKLEISTESSFPNAHPNAELMLNSSGVVEALQDDPNFMEYVAHLVESICSTFPDVPVDCILEALKANAYSTEMTVSMISDLWYADTGPEAETSGSSAGDGANPDLGEEKP